MLLRGQDCLFDYACAVVAVACGAGRACFLGAQDPMPGLT